MTDHEKLLVELWCEEDPDTDGEVSVLDVMAMLFELGQEHRRAALARDGSCYRGSSAATSRSAA